MHPFRFGSAPRAFALATALAALQAPAAALEYTWLGGDGSFEDATRWSLAGTPGASDTARITFTPTVSRVRLDSMRSLGRLWMDGGSFGGPGTLQANTLRWDVGRIGFSSQTGGGTLGVSGGAEINGAALLELGYSHSLKLDGGATWSVGNGSLTVQPPFTENNVAFPGAALSIAAGTTFADLGAFDNASTRSLGGRNGSGRTDNAGTYRREGLGETRSENFHNSGRLEVRGGSFTFGTGNGARSSSTGVIELAAGTTLFIGDLDLAGRLDNLGRVVAYAGRASVSSSATIGGAWQLVNTGFVRFEGSHGVASLAITSGTVTGPGILGAGRLELGFARIGDSSVQEGGTVVADGPARFDGGTVQHIAYSHRLELRGDATWSAGNGRIEVDSAYTQGSQSFPAAVLDIGAGTRFVDAGAATAGAFRQLGSGGRVVNDGTYRREGLGGTLALNFDNRGRMEIAGGVFQADERFRNTGVVEVSSGTWLVGSANGFRNDGVMQGHGALQAGNGSGSHALINAGVLSPGAEQGIGTLSVLGDLTMTDSSTLRIELGAPGLGDRLVVTDQALWNGTLALVAGAGFAPAEGQSFIVASTAQRLAGSTFDSLNWSGPDGVLFAIDYGSTEVTVRVTAVPEPATWLMLLSGAAWLAWRRRGGQA